MKYLHILSKSEEKEKFSFHHIKRRDYLLMLTYFYLSRVSSDPGRFIGQPGCPERWQDRQLLLLLLVIGTTSAAGRERRQQKRG
jgi:hypothetical protein